MSSRRPRNEPAQEGCVEPHHVALDYVHGRGARPAQAQLDPLHSSLYHTVLYVDSLHQKIAELARESTRQTEAHRAEIARLRAEIAEARATASVKPAQIELLSASKEEIIGSATPCGQVMKITQPGMPFPIYAACYVAAGMTVFGGRCPLHAFPKAAPAAPTVPTAPASAAPAAPAATPASYATVAQSAPVAKK